MKKYTYIVYILLTFMSCKKETLQEPLPDKTNPNLKYFGYTLVDVGWDDPTDKSDKTNYIDEVYSFSNIADILVVEPTDNIVDRINVFDSYNVKAMLHRFSFSF